MARSAARLKIGILSLARVRSKKDPFASQLSLPCSVIDPCAGEGRRSI